MHSHLNVAFFCQLDAQLFYHSFFCSLSPSLGRILSQLRDWLGCIDQGYPPRLHRLLFWLLKCVQSQVPDSLGSFLFGFSCRLACSHIFQIVWVDFYCCFIFNIEPQRLRNDHVRLLLVWDETHCHLLLFFRFEPALPHVSRWAYSFVTYCDWSLSPQSFCLRGFNQDRICSASPPSSRAHFELVVARLNHGNNSLVSIYSQRRRLLHARPWFTQCSRTWRAHLGAHLRGRILFSWHVKHVGSCHRPFLKWGWSKIVFVRLWYIFMFVLK